MLVQLAADIRPGGNAQRIEQGVVTDDMFRRGTKIPARRLELERSELQGVRCAEHEHRDGDPYKVMSYDKGPDSEEINDTGCQRDAPAAEPIDNGSDGKRENDGQ